MCVFCSREGPEFFLVQRKFEPAREVVTPLCTRRVVMLGNCHPPLYRPSCHLVPHGFICGTMNLAPFSTGAPVLYARSTGDVVPGRYLGINEDGTYRCDKATCDARLTNARICSHGGPEIFWHSENSNLPRSCHPPFVLAELSCWKVVTLPCTGRVVT